MVLAKLHNTAYLETISAMPEVLLRVLFVGAFESGFHQNIPLERRLYGVPYEWYEKYGVQRLRYHGASHAYKRTS
jgi:acetate kinase